MILQVPLGIKKRTQWLLIATLLLSLFSFSGDFSISSPKDGTATQRELLIGNRSVSKRTISYNFALRQRCEHHPLIHVDESSALFYSQHVKTTLDHLSRQLFFRSDQVKILPSNKIPYNSDEDHFTPLLG